MKNNQDNKYHVCHMTSVHKPNDDRIVLKECVSLLNAGYNVSLVYLGDLEEVIDARLNYVCAGKAYVNRKKRATNGIWNVFLKAKSIDANLYHFHDPELIPIGILLHLSGKKVIYDVHEDLPKQILSKEWLSKYIRKPISFMAKLIEKLADYVFDGIVVVLPSIATRFNINKCVCIYNYPLKEELYSNIAWKNRKIAFGYAGGLTKIRCLSEMVQAIKYTNTNLYLAGTFETIDDKEIILQNTPQVIYQGILSREGVKALYAKVFCGLVLYYPEPNHMEAQPAKMKEYMAAGIPFIASDFPEWCKLVEQFKCGICVNPLNVQAIANAMQWMVEHPAEAQKMGENGRKAVVEHFSWESEENKLFQLYEAILGERICCQD